MVIKVEDNENKIYKIKYCMTWNRS